jgi:site-specific recombinase XerD
MRNGTYKSNLNKFSKYLKDKSKEKCSECDETTCICFVENFKKEKEKKNVKK